MSLKTKPMVVPGTQLGSCQPFHLIPEPQTRHQNDTLQTWVQDMIALCKPKHVHWCDGSQQEYDTLCQLMVDAGTLVKLNQAKRPNSFLARSHPSDVARVEACTYVCTHIQDDAGPSNNWKNPLEMKIMFAHLFDGAMKNRTMYVIPFCMGPLNSPYSRFGVEITDSPYVAASMFIMTRMGDKALKAMNGKPFLPCLHSVGCPLEDGQQDVPWPCSKTHKYIAHFPDEPSVISYGSGYGGNALCAKKCFALRIASVLGRKEGWMAEHCLILSLTSPEGKTKYIAAAFPSACGKTNLAMLTPTIPGWKVRCVGDDIAWMFIKDGQLRAINPESGFFGVAPGTSNYTNQSAMQTFTKNSIFTNVALTPDLDVWWEGMTSEPPLQLQDWLMQPWTPDCGRKAAHPNSRYTCPANQCPTIDPAWENPEGVPISAIIFGGRRSTTVPLVTQALDWPHGVFLGSITSSEQTAAAEGPVGLLRMDPFSMKPFCGYNMGHYFQHWLDIGKRLGDKAPKIFHVNWFRKNCKGEFIWPGFGENSRVLKWIFEQADGQASSIETPIGRLPQVGALDIDGLNLSRAAMEELLAIDKDAYLKDFESFKKHYENIGSVPQKLWDILNDIYEKLQKL